MWRCHNVGGLGEHVTCHLFRFLSKLIPFYGRPMCQAIMYRLQHGLHYECNEPQSTVDHVVTYLFHDHSPDDDGHQSILSCKLLAVTRETKLTLSIAPNPKSKLTLACGTNPTNRNTRACLSIHYRHPQQEKMPVIRSMLFWRHVVGVREWGE